MMGDGTTRNM